jgi:hypothetical protein
MRDRYSQTQRYVLAQTLFQRGRDTWSHFLIAADLAQLIEADGMQHLHAHFSLDPTRVSMVASMLTEVPFSFTSHAFDIFNQAIDFRLLREHIDRAAFVVTVSHHNREFLDRHADPLVDGNVRTLYNGIDLRKFSLTRQSSGRLYPRRRPPRREEGVFVPDPGLPAPARLRRAFPLPDCRQRRPAPGPRG